MAAVASGLFVDTHVAVWLAAGELTRLSRSARGRLDKADPLLVSPVVLLELAYLHEIGRLTAGADPIFQHLSATIGLRLDNPPMHSVVAVALGLLWTRDPFDRLICAHALTRDTALLTKDQHLRGALTLAVWD